MFSADPLGKCGFLNGGTEHTPTVSYQIPTERQSLWTAYHLPKKVDGQVITKVVTKVVT